jgi:hypothetical protein
MNNIGIKSRDMHLQISTVSPFLTIFAESQIYLCLLAKKPQIDNSDYFCLVDLGKTTKFLQKRVGFSTKNDIKSLHNQKNFLGTIVHGHLLLHI